MKNKSSAIALIVMFAIGGFVMGLPSFLDKNPFGCLPGFYVALTFVRDWLMDRDGFVLIPYMNAACFGLLGALIVCVFRSAQRRAIAAAVVGLALLCGLAGLAMYQDQYRREWERSQKTRYDQLRQVRAKLEADPNDVHLLHWMGVLHFTAMNDPERAEECFRRIVACESAQPFGNYSALGQQSLLYLAIICQGRGDHPEAESLYNRFLATNPDLERDGILSKYNHDYMAHRPKNLKPSGQS
jgi:tetratricopeptide (TPR) repeat protein